MARRPGSPRLRLNVRHAARCAVRWPLIIGLNLRRAARCPGPLPLPPPPRPAPPRSFSSLSLTQVFDTAARTGGKSLQAVCGPRTPDTTWDQSRTAPKRGEKNRKQTNTPTQTQKEKETKQTEEQPKSSCRGRWLEHVNGSEALRCIARLKIQASSDEPATVRACPGLNA